jgi:hypothetical protein
LEMQSTWQNSLSLYGGHLRKEEVGYSLRVGGMLHLITKDVTFIIKHMIPPTLRSRCTNPPCPTPCDLHMFKFMKTFTL